MSDPSVKDVLKQISLAEFDGEIKSIAVVAINQNGEPEIQVAIASGTMYPTITALEILKLRLIDKLISDGGIEVKDRE